MHTGFFALKAKRSPEFVEYLPGQLCPRRRQAVLHPQSGERRCSCQMQSHQSGPPTSSRPPFFLMRYHAWTPMVRLSDAYTTSAYVVFVISKKLQPNDAPFILYRAVSLDSGSCILVTFCEPSNDIQLVVDNPCS